MSKQKLTAKQTGFADSVVAGMSLSDSYRANYNADKMAAPSIHVNSCKLAANAKVALRIEQGLQRKAQQGYVTEVSVRSKVLAKLEALMDSAETENIQLGAAIALGKSVALFSDVMIDRSDDDRSVEEITAEIERRLAAVGTKH